MSGIIDAHQHVWDLAAGRVRLARSRGRRALPRTSAWTTSLAEFAAAGVDGHRARAVGRQRRGHRAHVRGRAQPRPSCSASSATFRSTSPSGPPSGWPNCSSARSSAACATSSTTGPTRTGCCVATSTRDSACSSGRGFRSTSSACCPSTSRPCSSLSERHPDLDIVIDHLNKPPIGLADHEPWASLMTPGRREPARARQGLGPVLRHRRSGRLDGRRHPADLRPRARRLRSRPADVRRRLARSRSSRAGTPGCGRASTNCSADSTPPTETSSSRAPPARSTHFQNRRPSDD